MNAETPVAVLEHARHDRLVGEVDRILRRGAQHTASALSISWPGAGRNVLRPGQGDSQSTRFRQEGCTPISHGGEPHKLLPGLRTRNYGPQLSRSTTSRESPRQKPCSEGHRQSQSRIRSRANAVQQAQGRRVGSRACPDATGEKLQVARTRAQNSRMS